MSTWTCNWKPWFDQTAQIEFADNFKNHQSISADKHPGMVMQEISDDLGRHRSDAQINNSDVTVLRAHEEVVSQWKHLQPGDLVKVWTPCLPATKSCVADIAPVHWSCSPGLASLPACQLFATLSHLLRVTAPQNGCPL